MSNPLLEQGELLAFDEIRPEHVTPALSTLLKKAEETLALVLNPATEATWETVVEPLQAATEKLGRAWGAVHHLMGVVDSEGWRKAYAENIEAVTLFSVGLSQNETLFAKYKALASSEAFKRLDAQKKRVIEHEIRDFRLSGAELAPEPKARLKELAEEQARLTQQFSQNVLDATDSFAIDLPDATRLAGLPQSALDLFAEQAEAAGHTGYRIGLKIPSYLPVMKYGSDRALRSNLHRAFVTRASDLGEKQRDNTPVIERLLEIREEQAALLGFKNFAEESLAIKMAPSPEAVLEFLRDIARRARPYALRDKAELTTFAKSELGLDSLQIWDVTYASEKLREKRYAFNAEEVREYFPLPKVLSGLFALAEKLYEVRIERAEAHLWHPDVQFFCVKDRHGNLIARFYADLYARSGKRGGAWMDGDVDRKKEADGTVRTPVAFLVCNFTPPVAATPCYLTHDDVTTLFHEFGHGLHQMLTRVDVAELSGINGVEWDAVEMPSQFMENWAWNYETLCDISEHKRTHEKLPEALFKKMLAAKNFQSGLFCLRQVEFALFDMLLHCAHNPDFMQVLADIRKEVAVLPVAQYDRFAHGFSHIFAGGYSAGYYSYKWAEVLSADAFSAFEENGLFDKATAKRWLDEVLSRGGTRDAIENFKAFRGREPSIEALMHQSGFDEPL